jgi:site-specific DNA-methyltransferase (adenine-specific)
MAKRKKSDDKVFESGKVLVGSCLDRLRELPDASIDSIVTDPPYELGFMGKAWDASGIAYNVALWQECLRVLKPGGHLLAFGGTRTYHRMAVAIEDAGFEIRDSIHWIYGSGFPKSLNVSKALDKEAGAERPVVGKAKHSQPAKSGHHAGSTAEHIKKADEGRFTPDVTASATAIAKQWEGWGTALKPAHEPIVLARKPLDGTVAANVKAHGTGALNIDASRIGRADGDVSTGGFGNGGLGVGTVGEGNGEGKGAEWVQSTEGRWPANVIFDEEAGAELDAQSGKRGAAAPASGPTYSGPSKSGSMSGAFKGNGDAPPTFYGDQGGASRFFYCAKPSKKERNAGLDSMAEKTQQFGNQKQPVKEGSVNDKFRTTPAQNFHPTVKPLTLMRYLVRLVTPPNGTVLDPFLGSGTTAVAATLEGFKWVGCELTAEYLPIIEGRVGHAEGARASEPLTLFGETS